MKSCRGWDQSLRSYRRVSQDAEVFQFCMTGNVTGLQRLFEDRQASPFEMDPEGRTPLHVRQSSSLLGLLTNSFQYAALYARPDTCQFLLENGADPNVRTSWHGKFDRSEIEFGKGWYPDVPTVHRYIEREEIFRGWPAYSYASYSEIRSFFAADIK